MVACFCIIGLICEGSCPDPWIQHEESCFAHFPMGNDPQVSFSEARAVCQKEGGDLAVTKYQSTVDGLTDRWDTVFLHQFCTCISKNFFCKCFDGLKAARNLGLIFDTNFSFRSHVSAVCRSCRYHIRDLRRIRRYLTFDSAKLLAHALVSSRLDYCNSRLCGIADEEIISSFNVFKTPWLVLLLRNHLWPAVFHCYAPFTGCQ